MSGLGAGAGGLVRIGPFWNIVIQKVSAPEVAAARLSISTWFDGLLVARRKAKLVTVLFVLLIDIVVFHVQF